MLTIDEKRKADRSFFGGKPWPEKRAGRGPEATERAAKARQMAQDLQKLKQEHGTAMMAFIRNEKVTIIEESDDFTDAPLQQALETLLNDGWSPVGPLVFEIVDGAAKEI
jgi:hypothetical protein